MVADMTCHSVPTRRKRLRPAERVETESAAYAAPRHLRRAAEPIIPRAATLRRGGSLYILMAVVMMPNEKNLKPLNKRTKKEQRKIQSAGGKASGEVRRQRKTLKENMNLILGLDVSGVRDFNKLTAMGIPVEDIDNSMLLAAALFQKAKTGDVAACKEVREWIGEEADTDAGVQIIDDY